MLKNPDPRLVEEKWEKPGDGRIPTDAAVDIAPYLKP